METTANLDLPFIMPSQAQKHVTHNEALNLLDALVQLMLLDRDLASPPALPDEGSRFLVASPGSGAWVGRANQIACFQDGSWTFLAPKAGWMGWLADEAQLVVWTGSAWNTLAATLGALQNLSLLGIGTAADAGNPFAAKLNKALWTAKGAGEGGDGDLRYTLNKETSGDTLALSFQTGYSGRAELGLSGDDDVRLKVSADGGAWNEAMRVARASGMTAFPSGIAHPATGRAVAQLLPCATPSEIWRMDAARPAAPRTYVLAGVSGNQVTLATGGVPEFFSDSMRYGVMVRVWNTSKVPAQPAWVTWNGTSTQFYVRDAAEVAGWASGETMRLGDPNPTGANTQSMIALDISPYLYGNFGTVFPQKGVLLGASASATGGDGGIDVSGSGASGSVLATVSMPDGKRNTGSQTVFTAQSSPVSSANLLFLRESLNTGTALSTCVLQLLGVYV